MNDTLCSFNEGGAFQCMDIAMAAGIASLRTCLNRTVIIGLCGPQGSGKSSTSQRLAARLQRLGLKAVACSLDDFYLTAARRRELAKEVHPLLATRGVPGTHDLALLNETLARLSNAGEQSTTAISVFDKTTDERAPAARWFRFQGRPDAIILEGWCIGARPQPSDALISPVNVLEEMEDSNGSWRRYVNNQLAESYAELFARLDYRLFLSPPSFESVFVWRAEQEAKLERRLTRSRTPMSERELRRFIAHYERLSRWLMVDEPADLIVQIGEDRTPLTWRWKSWAVDCSQSPQHHTYTV